MRNFTQPQVPEEFAFMVILLPLYLSTTNLCWMSLLLLLVMFPRVISWWLERCCPWDCLCGLLTVAVCVCVFNFPVFCVCLLYWTAVHQIDIFTNEPYIPCFTHKCPESFQMKQEPDLCYFYNVTDRDEMQFPKVVPKWSSTLPLSAFNEILKFCCNPSN